MDFSELIEVRRSVRQYAKSEIAPKEMEAIVADALNAPSWKNSETTRYHAAVGEAAKKNGFCHYNHFTKACRKYYGASPTEIKRQKRQRDVATNTHLVRSA